MSRAEERALERFPVHKGASEQWIKAHLKGICGDYIEGYEQAEKDLQLTWEDMKYISSLYDQIPYMEEEDFYKEMLRRFQEYKRL